MLSALVNDDWNIGFAWLSLTVVESNRAHIMAGSIMDLVRNTLHITDGVIDEHLRLVFH